MFLPRSLIAHLYLQLLATQHPLSPPVLILTALEPDALCACRILAALLKRDYVPHKIKPISGYEDLLSAGENMVKPMRLSEGGTGGVVVCLGAGGLVPLADYFGLEPGADNEIGADGVNVWVLDSRRPYNLTNVFGRACSRPEALTDGSEEQLEAEDEGVERGRISRSYKPGRGGIIVFDDGDIEEDLDSERNAYFELENMRSKLDKMPDADREGFESDSESDGSQDGRDPSGPSPGQKRKSWDRGDEDDDDEESDKENARPHQRRRSNNVSPNNSHRLKSQRLTTRQSHHRYLHHRRLQAAAYDRERSPSWKSLHLLTSSPRSHSRRRSRSSPAYGSKGGDSFA